MTSNVGVTSFLLVFVTSFALLHHAASETYNVLETLGWTVPDNGDAYPNWAANKKFKVGDTLGKPLNFRPRILEMSSTNQTSIIRQGHANINLTSICPHYFICTIGEHCQFGQKLTINPGNSAYSVAVGSLSLLIMFISTIVLR
ncbi:stellacyanin-like [Papaver somniferum]|uniref:stellacyanin-like n=1 Tax=Papaver somniferum TaxID=3469 RepID=UPI000E6FC3D1|nr:stellacyanin-like [Papaver somniferum]